MNPKKYTLKPGKHQFAPGSPAEHDNDNTSDEEIAWYLKAYPHIAALIDKSPEEAEGGIKAKKRITRNQTQQSV